MMRQDATTLDSSSNSDSSIGSSGDLTFGHFAVWQVTYGWLARALAAVGVCQKSASPGRFGGSGGSIGGDGTMYHGCGLMYHGRMVRCTTLRRRQNRAARHRHHPKSGGSASRRLGIGNLGGGSGIASVYAGGGIYPAS